MPEKSTDTIIAEMYTDIKWIKKTIDKKAGKWTERVLILLMIGTGAWMGRQILDLIPVVKAAFAQII